MLFPKALTIALTIVISLVWVANVVIGYVDPTRGNTAVNAIFTIVIGVMFGGSTATVTRARRKVRKMLDGDGATPDAPEDGTPPGEGTS